MNMVDLDSYVEGTDVTFGELFELGNMTLSAAASSKLLGHVSITGLTDYTLFPDTRMGRVLRAIVWSTLVAKGELKSEYDAELEGILWDSGWMHHVADKVAQ